MSMYLGSVFNSIRDRRTDIHLIAMASVDCRLAIRRIVHAHVHVQRSFGAQCSDLPTECATRRHNTAAQSRTCGARAAMPSQHEIDRRLLFVSVHHRVRAAPAVCSDELVISWRLISLVQPQVRTSYMAQRQLETWSASSPVADAMTCALSSVVA
jgi:hypothetical protein